jgi:hypothetical protein
MTSAYSSFLSPKCYHFAFNCYHSSKGEESLGAAWERFMLMANSRSPHGTPEEMLMQHFIGDLKSESAHFMNVASE